MEEAYSHFHDAMEGRIMEGHGAEDDITNLGKLVQWMRDFPAGGGAHKVLLGNCDLRQVPPRMRQAYLRMQVEPSLHNLWLQCCVGVIRAAWAAHDAAVDDMRAAAAQLLPVIGPDGADVPEALRPTEPQTEVRELVANFSAIRPNRRQHASASRNGRARPACAAQNGGIGVSGDFSGELPPLGSLGELARRDRGGQGSSSSSSSGNVMASASSAAATACAVAPLPALSGLGELASRGAGSAQASATVGSSSSSSGSSGRKAAESSAGGSICAAVPEVDACDVLSLMGFTPTEVLAARAEVGEVVEESEESHPTGCGCCDVYDDTCGLCRMEREDEAADRRAEAAKRRVFQQERQAVLQSGVHCACPDCRQHNEACGDCIYTLKEMVRERLAERAAQQQVGQQGGGVRS